MADDIPVDFAPSGDGFDIAPFHRLIQRLRDPENGCPWDINRDLAGMGKTLAEEAAEAAEALAGPDTAHQCEELGDVLMNIMLAVVIAEERELFTWREVIEGITAKMVRRHPHVFGEQHAANADEALELFLAAKAKEKGKEPHVRHTRND